jgi:AcrR family transcriptional regulator
VPRATPKTARPRAEKPSVREAVRNETRATYREAILVAAERVFGRLGFYETKMTDVAAEAGVAAGTLYNYFTNKDEIFASIIVRSREQLDALVHTHDNLPDPLERTRMRLRDVFTFIEEHGPLFASFIRVGGFTDYAQKRVIDDDHERGFSKYLELSVATLREAVERGQVRRDLDIELLATLLSGMCDSTIFAWFRRGCPPGLPDHADKILDLLLRGVRP